MMSDICVVHLVRAQNSIGAFTSFINSYRSKDAGLDHDLLIVFKGFKNENEIDPYRVLLADVVCHSLFISDKGYDIHSYFTVAKQYIYHYFCFLNSFSILLHDGWLKKLYLPFLQEGIGLVGATSSWLSWYSHILDEEKGLLTFPPYKGFVGTLRFKLRLWLYQKMFDPFPNYFIRTNGFMISRSILLQIRCGPMLRKIDLYRFESGKRSLTKQIIMMGYNVLLVDKNGQAYEKECWCKSGTFMQGNQENLLIADNQTERYREADVGTRRQMAKASWGCAAMPAPPEKSSPSMSVTK